MYMGKVTARTCMYGVYTEVCVCVHVYAQAGTCAGKSACALYISREAHRVTVYEHAVYPCTHVYQCGQMVHA